ncbi:MAG: hypothetical protein AABM40_05820 [Chloroflexota bacterium]
MLLRALGEQLPRVEATASLRRAAEVALGSGTLKREDAAELRARWMKQAAVKPARARTWGDNLNQLAAMGIQVEVTKAPPKEAVGGG